MSEAHYGASPYGGFRLMRRKPKHADPNGRVSSIALAHRLALQRNRKLDRQRFRDMALELYLHFHRRKKFLRWIKGEETQIAFLKRRLERRRRTAALSESGEMQMLAFAGKITKEISHVSS